MHNRRARPTLRLLREDLISGWESPWPQRVLANGDHRDLHPVSELPHPIIDKARNSFGPDPKRDNFVGPIVSSTQLRLLEIKQSQWRGGIWRDPETGVCWLVVAGLAKGDHKDRDDFYQRVQRSNDSGASAHWLPTEDDTRLLKQETAARLRTEWELHIQESIRDRLRTVHKGGHSRLEVEHPVPGEGLIASVDLTVSPVRDDDYQADEIELEVTPHGDSVGSNLVWQLTIRALITLSPPEHGWDRFRNTFSNIGEADGWGLRLSQLDELVEANELAESEPGMVSHYAHRKHLAGNTINGDAIRALCGVYLVPVRDHEALPVCPTCQQRLAELPG